MSEKVELWEKIQAVDQGIVELWDAMNPDQQKALAKEFYILNRWISGIQGGSTEVQQHYVLAVNEYYNKGWNELQKHPKLLWHLLCMCKYDGKIKKHQWIAPKKIGSELSNKRAKVLEELYPLKKYDEIDLLSKITTDEEVAELARDHGWEESEIKKKLK